MERGRASEALARENRALRALAEVARELSQTLDLPRAGELVVSTVLRLLRGHRALLYELDPASGTMRCRAAVGQGASASWVGREFPVGQGLCGVAMREGAAVSSPDVRVDARVTLPEWVHARIEDEHLAAGLAVPLVAGGTALGALLIVDAAGRVFDEDEQQIVRAFADQAALALANARTFGESEARRREAEALAAIGRELAGSLDLAAAAARVLAILLRVSGGERGIIYRFDRVAGVLRAVAAAGVRPERWIGFALRVGEGIAGRAIAERRPVQTPDLLTDPAMQVPPGLTERVEEGHYRAAVGVPLMVQGEIVGALGIGDVAGRVWDVHELAMLTACADQAALALERARLFEDGERRRREAEVLADLARVLNASLDLDVILQRVADGARDLLHCDLARIALAEPGGDAAGPLAAVFRYGTGVRTEVIAHLRAVRGQGLAGRVLETGRPLRTERYEEDARFSKDFRHHVQAEGIVTTMGVAICIEGRVAGLLHVDNRTPRPFTEADEAVLVRLADHAAVAIRNAQLFAAEQHGAEALRQSEERYRDLVENATEIVYTHDTAGRFTSLNRAGERITGYARAEALGMSICDLLPPEDRPRMLALLARAERGEEPLDWQGEIVARDGRRVALEVSARRVLQGGRWVGVQGVARDVTARIRLEDQLRQAQKMEAIGRLAGGVAHDFNNLLTVIGGRTDLLLERVEAGDPLRRDLDLIRSTTERAAGLTQRLLAFSRKQVLQPRALDLNGVIEGLAPMLRRLIGEDIELAFEPGPELAPVRADPGQLEQVILNLAVNARDAMPAGGRLTIATRDAERGEAPGASPGARTVAMSVRDTGAGIDVATQERLFEPFFTTKEVGKGTGLGLATVYGIVTQSGGQVAVSSQPGEGTVFTVYLPAADEATLPAASATDLPPAEGGTETILLVEDERDVRELARDLLEAGGYAVLDASGPEAALLLVAEHAGPLHLLLTDVVMPRMSGRELAERLLASRPDVRVLYMSGYTDDAIGRHGILDSDTAFLQKPFTAEALARKVREVLDGPAPG